MIYKGKLATPFLFFLIKSLNKDASASGRSFQMIDEELYFVVHLTFQFKSSLSVLT